MPQSPTSIALFDLDGTLLPWDCQILFRHHVVSREPWRIVFLLPFLLLLPFAKMLGIDTMKRVFLAFLWRMDSEMLAAYAKSFADEVMSIVYPEVKALLDEHRAKGHLTILCSASPEIYSREIGKNLGFDLSLGTVVEYGPLFPDLINNKGHEKVVRLHRELPAHCFENGMLIDSHGYTDSTADLPMLAICHCATLINPSPKLTAIGEKNDWQILRPPVPWKSKVGKALMILRYLTCTRSHS